MTACVSQPKVNIPKSKFIPCEAVKPIYLPRESDTDAIKDTAWWQELENAIVDYDIAFDKSCS
jgi:hypothetical protein